MPATRVLFFSVLTIGADLRQDGPECDWSSPLCQRSPGAGCHTSPLTTLRTVPAFLRIQMLFQHHLKNKFLIRTGTFRCFLKKGFYLPSPQGINHTLH